MEATATVGEYIEDIERLTAQEQLLLAQRILANLSKQLEDRAEEPLQSLLGIWQGFSVTDEDITEMRSEMWHNFGDRGF